MAPVFALRGALAESWEQLDATTYVFHIRQGVHWHDKPPVNGRELTASDVEHSFHRYLGLGSGCSEPSPMGYSLTALPFESVEATDEWTVVMKLEEPRLAALSNILDWAGMAIQPPEVIEQHGDMTDWRNLIGTGPFMITDRVEGSSTTHTRNPNYWGYDEKYPENQLPYIDKLVSLIIVEVPTMLAGLRSGTIDYIGWQGAAQLNTVDQAESLRRTNPELVIVPWSERSNNATLMNVTKPPYDDIRVRHAMQMALDLESMIAVKEHDYLQAATATGSTRLGALVRHVLPNVAAPIIVVFSINIGAVIISEASLSFLGFGLPVEIPSWGTLLSRDGRKYMEQAPWLALWPGLCLTLTVYSLNMFGDAVRDLLDPRLRGRAPQPGSGRRRSHR